MKTADVIIIGGGLIGCAIARSLAKENLSVMVLDKQQPGLEASRAAAGMLSPQSETDSPDQFFRLCMASRDLYSDFAAAISEESGVDVEYRTDGTVVLAFNEDQAQVLVGRAAWQQAEGLNVEVLSAEDACVMSPAITPEIQSALFVPDDHQINNRKLTSAVTIAAARAGAEIRTGHPVDQILSKGNRATGLRVNGQQIECGTIINAAGCWAGLIESVIRPSTIPVRGQMIALRSSSPIVDHVIHTPGCYIVPRLDGRIIIGSTTEHAGFDKSNTAAGVTGLLSAAVEAVPDFAQLPIDEMWAGLRPGTLDGLPLLGRAESSGVENLIFATGHYKNGILLTPITALLITEMIMGGNIPPTHQKWLREFRPDRFTASTADSLVGTR
ncbi:MAG TPA: glycine oxidase ThiO [Blastocatellia bacterium]|nr:glycine oxidase ThiO [Blastocatellia bacterium]